MRQAGRYLPAYRAIRQQHSFIEMCETPEIAFEISRLPLEEFDLDAIIVFYDILIPLRAMGAPLDYTEEGPVFAQPIRDEKALGSLHDIDPERDAASLLETLAQLRQSVGDAKAVLGFAGAPFTLASYLIEGRVGGRGVETVLRSLYARPAFFHQLLDRLADMTTVYLRAQLDAGADAVQLFDTWAGRLGVEEYREFALPYHQRIFRELGADKATGRSILFVRDGVHLVEEMALSGASAVSVDWRVPLADARRRVGPGVAVQGNLDPAALFGPVAEVERRTTAILEDRRDDPSYIFNLGHGVLPETPVESVRALVETVKGWSG